MSAREGRETAHAVAAMLIDAQLDTGELNDDGCLYRALCNIRDGHNAKGCDHRVKLEGVKN